MARGDLKTSRQVANLLHSTGNIKFKKALNSGEAYLTIYDGGNLIILDDVLDKFSGTISHKYGAVTSKTATISVIIIVFLLSDRLILSNLLNIYHVHCPLLIVNGSKLLCILDNGRICLHLICQRGFWRVHTVVNIVSFIGNLVEQFTAEGVKRVVAEICLDLHVKGSHQLSVLVLTPFGHVLALLKGYELLSL